MAFCSNCGSQMKEGAAFCHECGTKNQMLATNQPPASQPYQAPVVDHSAYLPPQPPPPVYQSAPQPQTHYGSLKFEVVEKEMLKFVKAELDNSDRKSTRLNSSH